MKRTPFTVAIDHREKAPWSFHAMPVAPAVAVPTVVRHLKSGDYQIEENESLIAIERKSLEDLYGTLGGNRERFEREIERLADAFQVAAVVVEASWSQVLNPNQHRRDWRSRLAPRSVFGTVTSWSVRYPTVHWFFAGNRRVAEIIAFDLFSKAWKEPVDD